MQTIDRKRSSARLAEINPEAMALYQQMRARVMPAPGVDAATCEIVLAMQLALLGHKEPFKIHATRALQHGVSLQQLQALVLAGVGVTSIAFEAARTLEWLQETQAELRRATPAG